MGMTLSHEFLAELGDINAFIADVMASPKNARWHWPACYLLYVDLVRLDNVLMQVHHFYASPGGGSVAFSTLEERVEYANSLFAALDKQQKAIVHWLPLMFRSTGPRASDPLAYKRLGAHVHPKSGWYQTFMSEYCSGVVAADGTTLMRTVLPADVSPSCERIDASSARCMIRLQSFDIGKPDWQSALADATDVARSKLGKIIAEMKTFLAEYCTLEDLLYPFSR